MLQTFIDFFSFTDPNVRYVTLGVVLLTASIPMVGTFTLLREKALVGDAVAHATLPGVCLAFIITSTQHTLFFTLGAFITGWMAVIFIDEMVRRTKIKNDTAIALALSWSFGVGIFLLTIIQQLGNPAQMGLSNFLFGKAAALVENDIKVLIGMSGLLMILIRSIFKELVLITFDKTFAQSIGLPIQFLEWLFTSFMVLAIVVGISTVGILLVTALLITPAIAARCWTSNLFHMLLLASFLGIIAGVLGTFISYSNPAMSTGPWIVIVISLIAYLSFLVAPNRGLLARKIKQHKRRRKMFAENILKLFYMLDIEEGEYYCTRSLSTIAQKLRLSNQSTVLGALNRLTKCKLLHKNKQGWRLTSTGKVQGGRISQLHLLWERYLVQKLNQSPQYVHSNAEYIEHIITPELAKELRNTVI